MPYLKKMLTTGSGFGMITESVVRPVENGILAQLGEHLPYKQRVTGSSPVGPIEIEYGEVAQLARAHGSYPWCRGFESPLRYFGFLVYIIGKPFCVLGGSDLSGSERLEERKIKRK